MREEKKRESKTGSSSGRKRLLGEIVMVHRGGKSSPKRGKDIRSLSTTRSVLGCPEENFEQ